MSIHRPQRNWGCRIHEVTWYGIPTVVLENESVRVSFLAGKGTDLVEFLYKPLDLDFAWLTPTGVRNPRDLVSTNPDPVAMFLDTYPGGWQEVFPNAGAPGAGAGASYGQHGEVFCLPWDVAIVEDTETRIAVRFTVRGVKSPCIIEKTVIVESGVPGIRIEETVLNPAPVAIDVMWGHHITFGPPFLVPGATISTPDGLTAIPHADLVAPDERRVASIEPFAWPVGFAPNGSEVDFSILPEPGTPGDLFYLTGFKDGTGSYTVTRPDTRLGMTVSWDAETLPYLWYWQQFGRIDGYPWYGRAWNVGLEPSSSYPTNGLPDAIANGSVLRIEPDGARSLWLTATIEGGTR